MTAGTEPGPPAATGAWAPLRLPVFRALWLAVLFSNVGTWMQTVGAQLLLVDEPRASTLVSLVQTASTLPVVLLALPAGVLADIFDRRRMLLAVQCYLAVVGTALTVLTALDQVGPPLLLLLTFALGVGTALMAPTYQALIPELVPRAQLPAASALGAVSMNLARAVGPAVAGLLIARVGTAAVFGINAVSFVVFALVLLLWRREAVDEPGERERFGPALRAGGRFVRHSPVVRRLLLRVGMFLVPAVVVWALLPLVATQRLGLGPSGYGVLLAALGIGAVLAVAVLPWVRERLSPNALLAGSTAVFAVTTAVVGAVPSLPVVLVALLPAGGAWVAVLSTMNVTLQLFLPGWVRGRGLAIYQIAFFGCQAAGSLAWGLVAEQVGVVTTFLAAAVLMAVGGLSLAVLPLREASSRGRAPAAAWPEPQLVLDPEPDIGPVLVTAAYTVAEVDVDAFLAQMAIVRRARQRTGAYRWQIYRDGETADRFVEAYLVPSWQEHLRQHDGRLTESDAVQDARARAFSTVEPQVHHLFPASAGEVHRS
ncbi:MAG TPA: MFS transporter [Mycobacteriales bacterium]|jgi:MFS family permease|nr:MFS transporter [Mycobacteriales bacterium]